MKNATTIRRPKKPDKLKFLTRISKKTQKAVYLEASKYISDLTKLIFGGIILTNILNFNIDYLCSRNNRNYRFCHPEFIIIFKRKGVNYGISLFMHNMYCYICSFLYLAYDSKWPKMVK